MTCSTARTGSAVSTAVRVTEEDLEQVLAVLSQDDSGVDGNWENVIDKQSDSVVYNAKRRDPKVCILLRYCIFFTYTLYFWSNSTITERFKPVQFHTLFPNCVLLFHFLTLLVFSSKTHTPKIVSLVL